MFGSGQKPLFGSTTSTGFGGGGGLFGTSGTGGFGTPTTPFGVTTPASASGGSIFGGTSGQASGGLFGSSNTSAFGQASAPAASGFSFGSAAQQPSSGGLFGQTSTNQTSSLFGTPTATNAFAQKTPGFGGTSTFGNTSSTGGLFGGNTSTAFGTPTPSAGASLFGGGFGAATPQQNGTTVKFNALMGSDTMVKNGTPHSISTRHQCITAMKEYETKSLEELRVEDYMANRKGPQAGSTTTTSLFGATAQPAGTTPFGGFGAAQTQKPAGFGFGSTASSGGLFGSTQTPAQQTAAGGLFGAQTKSLFGAPATTTAASSLFGSTTSTSFGFGAQSAQNKSLFGAPASTQSTSIFGATPASSTGFSFGAATNQTSSLFGSKPAAPFGSTAASAGGLTFGQPSTSTSIFGKPASTSAFGFGAPGAATPFGQTSTSSLFGQKPATLGATTGFGTTTGFGLGATPGAGSSLFSGQSKPTFGFGATTATPAGGLGGGLGGLGTGGQSFGFNTTQPTLGQQSAEAAQQQNLLQQQLQALVQSPYGDSPLFRNLKNDEKRDEILRPTNPSAQKASLNESSLKIGAGSGPRIKPRPLHPLVGGKAHLFDGLEDSESSFGMETFVCRKSVKKLVIRPSVPCQPQQNDVTGSGGRRSPLHRPDSHERPTRSTERPSNGTDDVTVPDNHEDVIRRSNLNGMPASPGDRTRLDNTMDMFAHPGSTSIDHQNPSLMVDGRPAIGQPAPNRLKMQTSGTATEDTSILDSDDDDDDDGRETPPLHPAGITLRRHGYYTIPSLDELRTVVDENGNCFVEDLTIGREGYGSVFFPGVTNLAALNLDEIVHFRRKEITVYPDDDRKPPIGDGLNKKAEVTLDCVWPNDKSTQSPIKAVDRLKSMNYTSKIETATARIGAKFIDYRPETGSWVFEVKHFSKYGLLDDSDDENSQFPEKDPKKLKVLMEKTQEQQLIQRQPINVSMEQEKNVVNNNQQEKQDGELSSVQKGAGDVRLGPVDDDADMIIDVPERPVAAEEDTDYAHVASSHRLATELGVNAHSMQVMKASFFGDQDMDLEIAHSTPYQSAHIGRSLPMWRTKTPIHDILDGRRTPSGLLQSRIQPESRQKEQRPKTFTSCLLAQKAHAPSPHLAEEMVRRPECHQHQVTITEICHTLVPEKKSYLYNRHECVMDASCYRNRAYRVGWGRNLTYVRPFTKARDPRRRAGGIVPSAVHHGTVQSATSLHQAAFYPTTTPLDTDQITKCLEINLRHCEELTVNNAPKLAPRAGVEALHEFSKLFRHNLANKESADEFVRVSSRVWELCVALWGRMPGYDSDLDESSYEYHIGRREAFQHWLTSTIRRESPSGALHEDYLSSILRCLCGDEVEEACNLATRASDYHLALLLAQVSSGHVVRDMVAKQLDNWKENEADEFIEPHRLKIYAVLAGLPVWRSTATCINTCEDLSWKQALAVHLLYHCEPNANISTSFDDFVSAFKGRGVQGPYCAPPLPDYLREEEECKTKDTCYHLIKLYTKKSHRLEMTLAPSTTTADHLDYRLSWHLYQILSSVGYSHLSSQHVAHLHSNYSAQLEAAGLWQWAVFVLLHLDNDRSRESSIRGLLMRHVMEATDDVISFLTEKLRIPPLWIHHAQAVYAGSCGNHRDEASHFLKAKMINRCHRVVLKQLAADAIINERYEFLWPYLESLSKYQARIHNWATRGGIYYDFIRLNNTIQELRAGNPSPHQLECLQSDVLSLTQRIGSLHCRSSRDRLCQSEIAERTATMLQLLASYQAGDDGRLVSTGLPVGLVAPYVSKLPMPEDYSLKLLRNMTEAYISEITS